MTSAVSILHALLLAFTCLPLVASTQLGCDLEGCEEHALLQRNVLAAKSIDRHSLVHGTEAQAPSPPLSDDSGTDHPPSATHGSHDALEELERLQAKTEAAAAKADKMDEVVGFAQNLADTVKCLKANSSKCSKPQLAEHVLGLLSAGLAMASVLPEVGMLASLGEVALKFFFPSGKKKVAPLTVKQVGDVIKTQLLDFENRKETEFKFPALNAELSQLIPEFGSYITSNIGVRAFKEFQSGLHTFTEQVQSITEKVREGWNVVLAAFDTNMAGLLTLNPSCNTTCNTNGDFHWTDTKCQTDLSTVLDGTRKFKMAANFLSSMSNSLALLASMAHGIYAKFNQSTDGPQLNGFTDTVLPLVKTGYKVAHNLVIMADNCSSLLTGWVNGSGTNMASLRTTDKHHAACSDKEWNGLGWSSIAKVSAICEDKYTGRNRFGFSWIGNGTGSGGEPAPVGVAHDLSLAKHWWLNRCSNYVGSIQLDKWGASSMCSNIWGQIGYEHGWYNGWEINMGSSAIIGEKTKPDMHDHLHICARPLACAPNSLCREKFSKANYEWYSSY